MIRITAAVVSAFIAATPLAAQGTSVIIQGASIIDVSTGAVQPAQNVLVEGNRIAAVGPQNAFAVPPDAVVVDGTGGMAGVTELRKRSYVGPTARP